MGLAEVKVLAACYSLVPAREAYAAAREAVAEAVRLEGETADGLYVQGMAAFCERDWPGSEHAFSRALELDPDHVRALCWSGWLCLLLGRVEEGMTRCGRAREVDPLAQYPYAMSGTCLTVMKRNTEAVSLLEQVLDFESGNSLLLMTLGAAYVALGRTGEAIEVLQQATVPTHRGGYVHGLLGWALAKAGRLDEARGVLAELRARPAPAPAVASEAFLLAELGEMEEAWEVLERCEREGQALMGLSGMSAFDPFRSDPRWPALLERLGLSA